MDADDMDSISTVLDISEVIFLEFEEVRASKSMLRYVTMSRLLIGHTAMHEQAPFPSSSSVRTPTMAMDFAAGVGILCT